MGHALCIEVRFMHNVSQIACGRLTKILRVGPSWILWRLEQEDGPEYQRLVEEVAIPRTWCRLSPLSRLCAALHFIPRGDALAAFDPMRGQNVERTRNDPAPLLMEAGRSPAEVRQYQLGLSWLQVMTGARHYIP